MELEDAVADGERDFLRVLAGRDDDCERRGARGGQHVGGDDEVRAAAETERGEHRVLPRGVVVVAVAIVFAAVRAGGRGRSKARLLNCPVEQLRRA